MDRHAFFQELAGEEQPLAFKPEHEPRIARLRERLGCLRDKRVFEPGCGAGPMTQRLAEWVGERGRVLALDACPEMVARCARAVGSHTHVQVLEGWAETTDLAPGAWDLVLCFRLYPHLENPAGFIERCRTALQPGGQLVIANLEGSQELNALHARYRGVCHDVMPAGEDLAKRLADMGWRVEEVTDQEGDYFIRAYSA